MFLLRLPDRVLPRHRSLLVMRMVDPPMAGRRAGTHPSAMDDLVEALGKPDAYPWSPDEVEVLETHISWLFFAGNRVLKVKKPVRLDFLDYGTLERRHHFCREEIRLNRRLAEGIYCGVVPVVRRNGVFRVRGEGEVVEWGVLMKRLPEEHMLATLLAEGRFGAAESGALTGLLSGFHRTADTGEGVDEHGRPEAVARKVLDAVDGLRSHAEESTRRELVDHVRRRAEEFLAGERSVLERRVAEGRIREGHGDLHAGNICFARGGIVIYDCIEFSRALRCGDVASDLSFLAMDLDHRGHPRDAERLIQAYVEVTGDRGLAPLLDFYKGYRATVRSLVAALRGGETAESRGYLHLSVAYTLPPALLLMCGLPGVGKSWAARRVARPFRAEVLRSDVVRKERAGIEPGRPARARWKEGLYSERATRATYERLLEDAFKAVADGRSAVVDASFSRRALRDPFLARAAEKGVPTSVIHVVAPEPVVRLRLERRGAEGGASDADLSIYRKAAKTFEPPDDVEGTGVVRFVSGEDDILDLIGELLSRRVGGVSGAP